MSFLPGQDEDQAPLPGLDIEETEDLAKVFGADVNFLLTSQLTAATTEEVNPAIEQEIKEATGITALEEEQARLEQEAAAQRREFASILEEAQAAPTEASRAAALARRRRRAGATRASTRVARGGQTPGGTSRTTLGG
jgi:hypothetical protein